MKLFHYEDHASCFQYENKERKPIIEYIEKKKGDVFEIDAGTNQIFFIQKGSLIISHKEFREREIKKNELLLLPMNSKCVFKVEFDTLFFIFHLGTDLSFCDHFPIELLYHKKREKGHWKKSEIGFLKQNSRITGFVLAFKKNFEDGLRCSHFLELKVKELCLLIRVYYHKSEVCHFFEPMVNDDSVFSNDVMKNYEKAKTMKELANMLHYSPSGFEKRFKKVFGKSPHRWKNEETAKKVHHEICCTQKTFLEISFQYGFSSASHFNDFCKMSFGCTPGEIRKQSMDIIEQLYS